MWYQTLYNDVRDWLALKKMGLSPDIVKTTGHKFVKALSDVLWNLDPNHLTFADRSISIPSDFCKFS